MTSVKRMDIVNEARRWKGTPFVHQGRILGKGVDCVGFGIKIRENLTGKKDIYPKNYSHNPETWTMKQDMDNELIIKDKDNIQIGDVLLLNTINSPNPNIEAHHLAVVVPYSEKSFGIIHCGNRIGKVIEHRLDDKWFKMIERVYQLPEVVD